MRASGDDDGTVSTRKLAAMLMRGRGRSSGRHLSRALLGDGARRVERSTPLAPFFSPGGRG